MRKLFVIIPFVMLLMSCAALYNGLEHGEKGVYLYKTYQHYKDEQIYCIGKCLVYSPHGVDYYEDSDVVVLNKTKQAFEDNEGCAVITENDSAYIQGAYSCSRYLDDNNISFVDSQKGYTVTGYVMHYTATSPKTPFLEITDGEKKWYIKLDSIVSDFHNDSAYTAPNFNLDIDFNKEKSFGEWASQTDAEKYNKKYIERQKTLEEKWKKEEKQRQEKQKKEREAFKAKHGKYKCGEDLFFALRRTRYGSSNFDNSCVYTHSSYYFKVLQQANDGTLVSGGLPTEEPILFFVTKNSVDSALVDGQTLPQGYLNPVGTYQYTTVMGATKTVYKFKRINEK